MCYVINSILIGDLALGNSKFFDSRFEKKFQEECFDALKGKLN
jgi:hypothetical protein